MSQSEGRLRWYPIGPKTIRIRRISINVIVVVVVLVVASGAVRLGAPAEVVAALVAAMLPPLTGVARRRRATRRWALRSLGA